MATLEVITGVLEICVALFRISESHEIKSHRGETAVVRAVLRCWGLYVRLLYELRIHALALCEVELNLWGSV